MKKFNLRPWSFLLLPLFANSVWAREVENLGKGIGRILGTTKASKKDLSGVSVFYTKDQGKPKRLAVVSQALWGGRCKHQWVIGIDYASAKVTDIAVTELSCPHALPIVDDSSFLTQFRGKGPADIKNVTRLSGINSVVKATGSCDLTNEAVVKAIALVQKNHAAF